MQLVLVSAFECAKFFIFLWVPSRGGKHAVTSRYILKLQLTVKARQKKFQLSKTLAQSVSTWLICSTETEQEETNLRVSVKTENRKHNHTIGKLLALFVSLLAV